MLLITPVPPNNQWITSMNAFATSTFYITVQKENRGLLRVIGVDVFWIISLIFFNNNNKKKKLGSMLVQRLAPQEGQIQPGTFL